MLNITYFVLLFTDRDEQEHGVDLGVFSRSLRGRQSAGWSKGQHWASSKGLILLLPYC